MSLLEKRLLRQVGNACVDFQLVEPGDRILVAVSGGKDSHALLYLLRQMQRRVPFDFSITAVNIDQGHPGFPKEVLPRYFEAEGYDYRIITRDTHSIVKEKIPEGKTYCPLCSRLRRGILYGAAREMRATKIALGHHRDDVNETLLLNVLYSGQIKSMPPRLVTDDRDNVVIRPLIYSAEKDLAAFADEREFPIIPCDLCGSQDNLKRQRVKRLIAELADENPNVRGSIFASLSNVRVTHVMDAGLRRVEVEPEPSAKADERPVRALPLVGRSVS